MSFSTEKRERIKNYILEKINAGDPEYVIKVVETFGISSNTVFRYIREMVAEGALIKTGNKKYTLGGEQTDFQYALADSSIDEQIIYNKDLAVFFAGLPENVRQIWDYAFMEMFNNVIEHSAGDTSFVRIIRNSLYTRMFICDNGIGIFKSISDYFQYAHTEDAVLSLFKGKLTTDPENHSGEGIFFTSQLMDIFAAVSSGQIFTRNNLSLVTELVNSPVSETVSRVLSQPGTTVLMQLSNSSPRKASDIFDSYADDDFGFTKTVLPMKSIAAYGFPASRSHARRICAGIDRFKAVTLDFDGISAMGQGFAHEIFVVFQKKHPDIKIDYINACEDVEKMILHVKNS